MSSSLVLDVLGQRGHGEHLGTSPTVELVSTGLSPASTDLFVEVREEEEVELSPVQVLHVFTVGQNPADCPSPPGPALLLPCPVPARPVQPRPGQSFVFVTSPLSPLSPLALSDQLICSGF